MKPMLASKFDEDKILNQLPVIGQPKLDGIRILIRDGIAWTRSLKPLRSSWVQSWVGNNKSALEGLDCEIITGPATAKDCYRRTSSAVMSFDNNDALESKLHVFDIWDSADRFHDRYGDLMSRSAYLPDFCTIVDNEWLWSVEDIRNYEFRLLSEGHEGVILRNPNSFYKFGRGTPNEGQLIKVKQFADTEATVIGFHEQLHNANEATTNVFGNTERSGHKENLIPMGVLGALEAVGHFPDGTEYSVRIGTGFDAEDRRMMWAARDRLIGKLVKFKYFEGGIKEAPRFPVFLGIRDPDDMSPKPEQMSLF